MCDELGIFFKGVFAANPWHSSFSTTPLWRTGWNLWGQLGTNGWSSRIASGDATLQQWFPQGPPISREKWWWNSGGNGGVEEVLKMLALSCSLYGFCMLFWGSSHQRGGEWYTALYSLWLFFLDFWLTTRWSTPWNSWLIQMWNAWCRNMTSNASHLCIVQLYKVSDGASQLQGPGSCLFKQQGFNSQELVIAECGRIRCNVHKIILITIRRRRVMMVSITTRIWMRLRKPSPKKLPKLVTQLWPVRSSWFDETPFGSRGWCELWWLFHSFGRSCSEWKSWGGTLLGRGWCRYCQGQRLWTHCQEICWSCTAYSSGAIFVEGGTWKML